MSDNKMRRICAGLVLCMSLASLTGCGSSDDENAESSVVGRVTAISSSKIVMDVPEQGREQRPEGERPDTVSGSGTQLERKGGGKPQGTPPSDGEKPKGTPPADGQKPEGTPPERKGESKTFEVSDTAKVYKQSGEEKTEITLDEVDLGAWVSISTADDVVTSIVIQDKPQLGNRQNHS